MKKITAILVVAVVIGAIVLVLMNNKKKTEAELSKNVELTPTVSVVQVSKQQKTENTLSMVGTVTANLDVMVVSETVGRVMAVKVNVGDRVQSGSVLVLVDDELKLAAFKTAEVNYEKSKKDLQRYEQLFKTKSITDNEVESARLACKAAEAQYLVAKRQFNDTRITSPIQGIVASRLVDRGHMVAPGTPIANIVDISTLKVTVNVAEKDVFKLSPGDKVSVTTDIYPETIFAGKINTISAKGDESHTYRVEVGLDNSTENPLKAGMFARLLFPIASQTTQLIIPRECLLGSRRNPQVFVVENKIAKLREITIGAEIGTDIEVLSGLSEGEAVIVNGQNNLNDGATVEPLNH